VIETSDGNLVVAGTETYNPQLFDKNVLIAKLRLHLEQLYRVVIVTVLQSVSPDISTITSSIKGRNDTQLRTGFSKSYLEELGF